MRPLTLVLATTTLLTAAIASGAGTPDLTGPWQVVNPAAALKTTDGSAPPLNADGSKAYASNQAAKRKGDPTYDTMSGCVPPGIPRLALQPFPFNIISGNEYVSFMYEWNHLPRIVYMKEGHFDGIGPTYLGQSVGHWDHDALVIDTTSFNDKTLLDDAGLPHSDQLHTVERYTLSNGGKNLDLKLTIDDPKTFSKSWDTEIHFQQRPDAQVKEDYCLKRVGAVK